MEILALREFRKRGSGRPIRKDCLAPCFLAPLCGAGFRGAKTATTQTSHLPTNALLCKVPHMDTNEVSEHLQVIRTLMERSALYRRALAPIMTYCGIIGLAGGVTGWILKLTGDHSFVIFWSSVALIALIGAFLLVRRQALKDAEPFWSPPTRRVVQALAPAFATGCFVSFGIAFMLRTSDASEQFMFAMIWAWFYGCAIHAAGFFMVRGMRFFGWLFIVCGCGLFVLRLVWQDFDRFQPHLFMGGLFGGLHLAYGVYLHFTENKKSAL